MRKPSVLVLRKAGALVAYNAVINQEEVEQLREKLGDEYLFVMEKANPMAAGFFQNDLKDQLGVEFKLDPEGKSRCAYILIWSGLSPDGTFAHGTHVELSEGELFRMADALLAHPKIVDVLAVPFDEEPMDPYELQEVLKEEEGIDFEPIEGPREWSPRGFRKQP